MKMLHTAEGFHYYWRRYLGWMPVQKCMVCGKWYWGGLPRFWFVKVTRYMPGGERAGDRYRFCCTWQASWMDYCSHKCCEEDMASLD